MFWQAEVVKRKERESTSANYFVRPQSHKADEVNALGMQDEVQKGQRKDKREEQRLKDEEQVMRDGNAGIEVEKRQA